MMKLRAETNSPGLKGLQRSSFWRSCQLLTLITCLALMCVSLSAESLNGQLAAGLMAATVSQESEDEVKQWSVTPAAEPELALQYRFFLDPDDRLPGNASEVYLRAMLLAPDRDEVLLENQDTWLGEELSDTDIEQIKKWLVSRKNMLGEIDRATRCEECVWDLQLRQYDDFNQIVMMMLPEFQELRSLARLMLIKARMEIASGDYDAAVESIRQMYQIGIDAAKAPNLICNLIGGACVGMANGAVEELIVAPNSPNLYWALASLPDRPIDIRPAIRFEVGKLTTGFEYLRNPEEKELSVEGWNKLMIESFTSLMQISGTDRGMPTFAMHGMATGFVMQGYPRAKRELVEQGFTLEELDEMPVARVVAIHQSRLYRDYYQDVYKWTLLDGTAMLNGMEEVRKQLDSSTTEDSIASREVFPFLKMLMPAVQSTTIVPVRIKRHITVLMSVEAVRHELAKSDGKLPQDLNSLANLPAPRDTLTGQPLPATLTEEGKLRIRLNAPETARADSGNSMTIDLEVAK